MKKIFIFLATILFITGCSKEMTGAVQSKTNFFVKIEVHKKDGQVVQSPTTSVQH